MAVHAFYEQPAFIILLLITLIILLAGIILHLSTWGHGKPTRFISCWYSETFRNGGMAFLQTLLFDVLFFRRIWRRSRCRWAGHMAVFWTFLFLAFCIILSVISYLLAWLDPGGFGGNFAKTLDGLHVPYDLLGYLLLAGSGFALGRRIFIKKVRQRSKPSDYFLVLCVFLIILSGMVAEWFSGYGTFVGKTIQNWDLALLWMNLHIYVALLLFVMVLPWTRFRHMITVPLLLLARRGGE